jgi:hypothetical protein
MAAPPTFISTLTELANQSLGMIGIAQKDFLADVATDTGVIAEKVQLYIYTVIRTTIGQLRPEELISRVILATPADDLTEDLEYDWGYRYTLPDDYVGTLWFDDGNDHLVEGGYVYCNVPENYIFNYIKYSIDPSEWSGELLEVMRYRISQAICIPITENEVKYEALLAEIKRVVEPTCERIMSYGKKVPNNRYQRFNLSRRRGRI